MKEAVAYCRVACAKQSDPSAEDSRDVPALHLRGERDRHPMDWTPPFLVGEAINFDRLAGRLCSANIVAVCASRMLLCSQNEQPHSLDLGPLGPPR